ncbi:MAG: 50S ribosomal protein L4 [Elusimicrobiales bacterium]|nr:50S ribosomal protein L4 [Elusimicrobiales bacterium]
METKLLDIKGAELGTETVPAAFTVEPDQHFLHEIVCYYLANKHRGTACTKTRSEVSGGGRKPWKQKGTGRARQGSTRSPIWRKGGVVFGPKPRSYRQYLPKQKLTSGLFQALSSRIAEGAVYIIENLDLEKAKTAELKGLQKALNAKRVLFVSEKNEKNFAAASRNIPGFGICLAKNLNAYEALRNDKIVITRAALKEMEGRAIVKEN